MNTKVKYFYSNKINKLLNSENYPHAEKLLKAYLKDESLPINEKSKIYELLGIINYQTGNYPLSKRYYNISLKYNINNINSLVNLGNILIIENRFFEAINLMKKHLKISPNRTEILKLLISCYSFIGDITHSKIIFEKLLSTNSVDEQLFVDYAYGYILNKQFDIAKKIILNGLNRYPESFVLIDAYEEFSDIELNIKEIKKTLLIPFLRNIHDLTFVKAGTLLTENMCIRGYFNFEIEKGLDLIKILQDNHYPINNSTMLAAICEYFTTISISDSDFTLNTIASFYNVSKNKLKKHIQLIEQNYNETIESFLSDINLFYNIELDKISEELGDFDE
ncbi:hypothetical protein OWM07_09330 [Deferribacter thermophilus]|uniref:tetratricopeptide repeat protein n=1 Tax=Deferribacter thermophilus TaxID=53573 RepID=UPI003C19279B